MKIDKKKKFKITAVTSVKTRDRRTNFWTSRLKFEILRLWRSQSWCWDVKVGESVSPVTYDWWDGLVSAPGDLSPTSSSASLQRGQHHNSDCQNIKHSHAQSSCSCSCKKLKIKNL